MRRILVVDDSTVMRAMYKHVLAQLHDCMLAFAADGQQALDLVSQEEPDLILLDVNMPVMNGLSVLERLKAESRLPRIRVIVVSTEGHDDDVKAAMDRGAIAYVYKPLRAYELIPVVERVLERGAAGSKRPSKGPSDPTVTRAGP